MPKLAEPPGNCGKIGTLARNDPHRAQAPSTPAPGPLPMKPSPLRRLLKPATATTPAGSPTDPATPVTGSAAEQQARTLLAAIDAGGIPLHPAKVNQIAAALGLPVSREEAVEATIARIRAALARPLT